MATVIPAHGTPRYLEPADGQAFALAELQGIVGGYIEALYTNWRTQVDQRPLVMFLNEDGKRLGLPVNHFATHIMRDRLRPDDFIVGDVVICTPEEAGEEPDDDEDHQR